MSYPVVFSKAAIREPKMRQETKTVTHNHPLLKQRLSQSPLPVYKVMFVRPARVAAAKRPGLAIRGAGCVPVGHLLDWCVHRASQPVPDRNTSSPAGRTAFRDR